MTTAGPGAVGSGAEVLVEYCGEWHVVVAGTTFEIGREADLHVDDNPYLHRRFLSISFVDGLWWLANDGSRISASISAGSGGLQASLAPGSRLPLVFGTTVVVFSAGRTTYELAVHAAEPTFRAVVVSPDLPGDATVGAVPLTDSQRQLIVALAEPMLRREGTGASATPSSAQAAARLGWTLTRFNRKLDNVCDKLHRVGVVGLRGEQGRLATNRRARLVEHAVSSRLVVTADLALLEHHPSVSARS